jgi:hypothetical protein
MLLGDFYPIVSLSAPVRMLFVYALQSMPAELFGYDQ